jgi:hypothetical protein
MRRGYQLLCDIKIVTAFLEGKILFITPTERDVKLCQK